MTKEEFIKKSQGVWGDIFSYEKTEVVDWNEPVIITCNKHGDFEQCVGNHFRGHVGCKFCIQESKGTDYKSFIEKSNKLHNNKYDYSLIDPTKPVPRKVKIICPVHGEFLQASSNHTRDSGCPKCSKNRKDNKDSFVEKANKKHNNKYNYDLVEYVDSKTKVRIICPDHGEFIMAPDKHLMGQKCVRCLRPGPRTLEEFVEVSNKTHNNKYDYSKAIYTKQLAKVEIICPIHGVFSQRPSDHMRGQGCPTCGNAIPFTLERFVLSASAIHSNKYDYSKVKFDRLNDKIIIVCPIHGEFEQRGEKHIRGQGCRYCSEIRKESKGATKIKNYLQNKNIQFCREFIFDDCKNIKPLPFDFIIYINNRPAIVEFNGEQHFKESWYNELSEIQRKDKIKRDYCKAKNIPLLDISYLEEKIINEKLDEFITLLKENKL